MRKFLLLSVAMIALINIPKDFSAKGIAMAYIYPEDLQRIGAGWYYVWGECPQDAPAGCVPMSYAGEDPNLPLDYNGHILLFNEPNNISPYGSNIPPVQGANIYLQLHQKYPEAKWVVGNVSAWALAWLMDFRIACGIDCPVVDAWGIHGYVEAWITPQYLKDFWTEAHAEMGGDFWITEWADTTGNIHNNAILEQWFETQSWIKRWAYFTNRANGSEPWYPQNWNEVQLFDWETGEYTEIGKWYAELLQWIYLPFIRK